MGAQQDGHRCRRRGPCQRREPASVDGIGEQQVGAEPVLGARPGALVDAQAMRQEHSGVEDGAVGETRRRWTRGRPGPALSSSRPSTDRGGRAVAGAEALQAALLDQERTRQRVRRSSQRSVPALERPDTSSSRRGSAASARSASRRGIGDGASRGGAGPRAPGRSWPRAPGRGACRGRGPDGRRPRSSRTSTPATSSSQRGNALSDGSGGRSQQHARIRHGAHIRGVPVVGQCAPVRAPAARTRRSASRRRSSGTAPPPSTTTPRRGRSSATMPASRSPNDDRAGFVGSRRDHDHAPAPARLNSSTWRLTTTLACRSQQGGQRRLAVARRLVEDDDERPGHGRHRPTTEDTTTEQRVRAYLGLGANLGDAPPTLARAVRALDALPGSRLVGVSRLYATRPVGVADQPEFHNAVVGLDVLDAHDPEGRRAVVARRRSRRSSARSDASSVLAGVPGSWTWTCWSSGVTGCAANARPRPAARTRRGPACSGWRCPTRPRRSARSCSRRWPTWSRASCRRAGASRSRQRSRRAREAEGWDAVRVVAAWDADLGAWRPVRSVDTRDSRR